MKILIVDDEISIQRYMKELLEELGYDSETAERADDATQLLADSRFDLVISDIEMPGRSGLELAGDLRRDHPHLPVILTTGARDEDFKQRSRQLGTGYLEKPFSADELLEEIESISSDFDAFKVARSES